MLIQIAVLAVVFILIAVRQIGSVKLQIWQIMLGGASVVLLLGQISPEAALKAINIDVLLFLFGMFVIGQALEESGYLSHLSYKMFRRAKTIDALVLFILFGMGIASAFLMNDTLAIIGTPVVLLLARKHRIHPQMLLLALAFAVTIGSAMSPIGNPQNLLIALNGNMENPFVTFFSYLFLPTMINLLLCFVMLKFFYRGHFHDNNLSHSQEPIRNHNLAVLSKFSLFVVLLLVALKIFIALSGSDFDFSLTYIALIAAAPILLFSRERFRIAKGIDWHTLVFFAAMFVLMESMWLSGFFQSIMAGLNIDLASESMVLLASVVISQFISNVPLVALYLPILQYAGATPTALVALAAGSTIAGNLLILGAASNIIIIQNAEKKANETITFLEFAKVGIPLTILNTFVYWIFLVLL